MSRNKREGWYLGKAYKCNIRIKWKMPSNKRKPIAMYARMVCGLRKELRSFKDG